MDGNSKANTYLINYSQDNIVHYYLYNITHVAKMSVFLMGWTEYTIFTICIHLYRFNRIHIHRKEYYFVQQYTKEKCNITKYDHSTLTKFMHFARKFLTLGLQWNACKLKINRKLNKTFSCREYIINRNCLHKNRSYILSTT